MAVQASPTPAPVPTPIATLNSKTSSHYRIKVEEHTQVFEKYVARVNEIQAEVAIMQQERDDQAFCQKLPGWAQEVKGMLEYIAEARPDFKVALLTALADLDNWRDSLNDWRDTLLRVEGECKGVAPTPAPTPRPTATVTVAPTPTPTERPTPVSTPRPTVTPGPTPTHEPISSVRQLVERYKGSIGFITVKLGSQYAGGTGFIVGTEGTKAFVVTNHHVINDADEIKFDLGDQQYDLTLLGSHEHEDVAVLTICCGSFTSLPSSSMPVTPGTEVVAVGFPARTEGIIHSQGKVLRLTQRYGSSSPAIEHTSELHPGSSGSPLFTTDGIVVGINKGLNVQDATKFIATSYGSVKSLIARWTGQVVSEDDVVQAQPSMWVIVTDDEVYVDTEFDFTDDYGMDVFVDGDEYCNTQRIYADDGRYAMGCESPDKPHADVERVSVQTRGGFDLRCQMDEDMSTDQETVFACIWR